MRDEFPKISSSFPSFLSTSSSVSLSSLSYSCLSPPHPLLLLHSLVHLPPPPIPFHLLQPTSSPLHYPLLTLPLAFISSPPPVPPSPPPPPISPSILPPPFHLIPPPSVLSSFPSIAHFSSSPSKTPFSSSPSTPSFVVVCVNDCHVDPTRLHSPFIHAFSSSSSSPFSSNLSILSRSLSLLTIIFPFFLIYFLSLSVYLFSCIET